jgi:circadian clock protein KaiB
MENDKVNWEFFLFISKKTPKINLGVQTLEKLCKEHLEGRYSINVIDVLLDPVATMEANIIATPTLLKKFPEPARKIIGDLSDEQKLITALEILNE